ncbi:SDR family NAD(P)-dependent oxidoreductase [Algisphaera agarilytica]|uniref:NAD(P)-dependent dehydrogenase (Short-subunit alcohol dehydrogenase family) n=1 Tax=Algisphaera agarilytica TaxID=1385975 RepID=A0A7X0H6Y8_9BACT|nr:SDR family NAD(P)-dependent oxidoreductase [Algisphaera agarilytica]MBB6430258.1 NAD(P)-dependent dehydrogenase (short-subunit alcohol dehydrogenase family) [Algisphaera agarilytica]
MSSTEGSSSVMVTGADRGIGLGLVTHYLQQRGEVIATTRREQAGEALAALAGQYPEQLKVLTLDVGDETSIATFGKQLESDGVTLDVVINNAGVSLGEPFGEWTAQHFATHLAVNTVGPGLIVQAIKPSLKAGSVVINITSGMASAEYNVGAENPLDAYAVSKCGLNILTRRLSEKLRAENIALIAMSPGWVQTEMGGKEAPTTVDDAVQQMTSTIATLGMDHTGTFIGPEGQACAW